MDHVKRECSFSRTLWFENLYDDFTLCYVRQDRYANYAADALECSPLYRGPRHVFWPDAHAAGVGRNTEEEDTVLSDNDGEHEDGAPQCKLRVEEKGADAQSVHAMSMRKR